MGLNHVNQLTHNDLRLVTLGGLTIDGGGEEVAVLNRQRRKLAVFVLLALCRRPMSRDSLVGMFWGDQDEARARHSLTEALSHIRRALGRDALATRLTEVALATPSRVQVDALDLAEAAAAGDHARAVALYRGPFLDGVHLDDAADFNDWADSQRARLQGLFVRSAAQVCLASARSRRWQECAAVAEQWIAADPTSVDAALYRLNALKAEGDRPALVRMLAEYERLRVMWRRDFELAPDSRVTALADEVAGRVESLPPASATEEAPREAATAVASIASRAEPAPAIQVFAARAGRGGRRLTAIGVGLGVVAATAFAWAWRSRVAATPVSGGVALTVMPFAYSGSDSTNAYLAEGLTEELSAGLGGVSGVRIIASGGGAPPADGRARAQRARSVGADAIVEGSVRSSSGRVRVTVRLVSAANADQLWAATYEQESSDPLAVERAITTSVVSALESRLGANVGAVAVARPVDPVTHDLYLRGRYFHNRSGVAALDRAAEYYRRAIERDSTYAPAWAGLAGVSLTKFNWGFSYGESVTPARTFVERALALDPWLSEAHATYSQLLRDDWRWQDAARELERALTLNPSDVTARHALSHLYFALQRPADALVEAHRAIALDPLNPRIGMHLCVAHLVAREYAEALVACRRGIELDPSFPDSHAKMAWVSLRLGRLEEARGELEREMAATGRTPAYLIQLALIDVYDGNAGRARALADSLRASTPPARLQYPLIAMVYAKLGDRRRTLEMLDEAVTSHADEVEEIVIEPEFDSLRSDPAFRDVVRRIGLEKAAPPR